MLALLYDVHGNLPALEAVLADARGQGADRYVVGGDVALFGAWPAEAVAAARALTAAWLRGNGERWTADPGRGAREPVQGAASGAREALGDDVAELGSCRGCRSPNGTRACHGSPVSDVRSFLPEPADDEAELLAGVGEPRLVFGHTHLPFGRIRGPAASSSSTPAASACRSTATSAPPTRWCTTTAGSSTAASHYDHDAVPRALRERYGDAGWLEAPLYRFTHARLGPQ